SVQGIDNGLPPHQTRITAPALQKPEAARNTPATFPSALPATGAKNGRLVAMTEGIAGKDGLYPTAPEPTISNSGAARGQDYAQAVDTTGTADKKIPFRVMAAAEQQPQQAASVVTGDLKAAIGQDFGKTIETNAPVDPGKIIGIAKPDGSQPPRSAPETIAGNFNSTHGGDLSKGSHSGPVVDAGMPKNVPGSVQGIDNGLPPHQTRITAPALQKPEAARNTPATFPSALPATGAKNGRLVAMTEGIAGKDGLYPTAPEPTISNSGAARGQDYAQAVDTTGTADKKIPFRVMAAAEQQPQQAASVVTGDLKAASGQDLGKTVETNAPVDPGKIIGIVKPDGFQPSRSAPETLAGNFNPTHGGDLSKGSHSGPVVDTGMLAGATTVAELQRQQSPEARKAVSLQTPVTAPGDVQVKPLRILSLSNLQQPQLARQLLNVPAMLSEPARLGQTTTQPEASAGKENPEIINSEMLVFERRTPVVNNIVPVLEVKQGELTERLAALMVKQCRLWPKQGSERLEILLKPEYLGSLQVNMATKDGILFVKFYVEHPEVKQILENNLPHLRQVLAEQGIGLGRIDVEVGQQSLFSGQSPEQQYRSSVAPKFGKGRGKSPESSLAALPVLKNQASSSQVNYLI
ncbi:MAG: flagellar hook-length control protein FliK, partial [Bacillota bacterium]